MALGHGNCILLWHNFHAYKTSYKAQNAAIQALYSRQLRQWFVFCVLILILALTLIVQSLSDLRKAGPSTATQPAI